MEWIINSYDRRTDRTARTVSPPRPLSSQRAGELLRDVWRGFVSAILPDGTEVKDVVHCGR